MLINEENHGLHLTNRFRNESFGYVIKKQIFKFWISPQQGHKDHRILLFRKTWYHQSAQPCTRSTLYMQPNPFSCLGCWQIEHRSKWSIYIEIQWRCYTDGCIPLAMYLSYTLHMTLRRIYKVVTVCSPLLHVQKASRACTPMSLCCCIVLVTEFFPHV